MIIALACLFLVSIVFINSLMCGQLIKRYLVFINHSMTFIVGFFMFIALIHISFLPIMLLRLTYEFIGYYFIVVQIILLLVYACNWRYSLLMIRIKWKKLIILLIGIAITLTILFTLQNYQYHQITVANTTWKSIALDYHAKVFNPIFVVFSTMIAIMFQISNYAALSTYLWLLPFAFIMTNLCYELIFGSSGVTNWTKQLLSFATLVLAITIFSVWIFANPVNGNTWILLVSILVFRIHSTVPFKTKPLSYIWIECFILTGAMFICTDAIWIIVVLGIWMLYTNFKNKLNNLWTINWIILLTIIINILIFLQWTFFTNIAYIFIWITLFLYLLLLISNLMGLFKNKKKFIFDDHKIQSFQFLNYMLPLLILGVMIIVVSVQGYFNVSNIWLINTILNKQVSKTYNTGTYYFVNVLWIGTQVILALINIYSFFVRSKTKSIAYLTRINYVTVWNPLASQFWLTNVANTPHYLLNAQNIIGLQIIDLSLAKLNNYHSKKYWIWLSIILTTLSLSWTGLIIFNFLG